jgi:hypothetical protein
MVMRLMQRALHPAPSVVKLGGSSSIALPHRLNCFLEISPDLDQKLGYTEFPESVEVSVL